MPPLQDVERAKSGANRTQPLEEDDPKTDSSKAPESITSTRLEHLPTSKINDIIRFFKLQALAPFNSWRSSVEVRKIALHWSHRIAVGHALLHLIPLCGAVTLLILNWSQYFVGFSFHSSTALQFVAKLLELFMQASIAEIILCIVRTQVLQGYVPLGALSATTQTSHVPYLWSLDFYAALTSHAFHGWRKCLFVVLVPLLIVLTALVGPSGAALMIPRPGSSAPEKQVVLNSYYPPELSYPSYLDSKQNLTFDIAGFAKIYKLVSNNGTEIRNSRGYLNREDDRLGQTSFRMLRYKSNFSEPMTVTATIPSQFSAALLDEVHFSIAGNETASIELPRPIVMVNCRYTSIPDASKPITYVLDDGTSKATIPSIMDLIEHYIKRGGSTDTQVSSLPPLWIASSEPGSSSYIFNFINDVCVGSRGWSSPRISTLYEDQTWSAGICFRFLTCSLAAHWESSKHELMVNEDGFRLVRTGPLLAIGSRPFENTRPISIDWDSIPTLNSTDFKTMVFRGTVDGNAQYGPCVNFAVSIVTIISEALWKLEPELSVPSDRTYPYIVTKFAHGYGFGMSTMASRLSLVIITIYCIVTVVYVTYILVSSHTSMAWSSATELIVLGLQSTRPEHLGNTSVGINSIRTYQEPVGIRVDESNKVELVFANDPGIAVRKLRKVVGNRAY